MTSPAPSPRSCVVLLVVLWAILCLGRILGPPDLLDNDQQRPATYLLDAALNGRIASQRDQTGDVMSKPPLSTWISIPFLLAFGHGTTAALYAPTALFVLAIGLFCHVVMSRYHDTWHGLAAGVAWLVSMPAVKGIALARTDVLFALTVALAGIAAFRAARGGGSWVLFWFFAALATLTKGPLGVLLAAFGLLGLRGLAGVQAGPLRAHVLGAALWVVMVGGWFAAAYALEGQDLIDKMIGRELLGHAPITGKEGTFGPQLPKPTLYFLSRFAPWSFLALVAVWRLLRHPPEDPVHRALGRFLAAWLIAGIVLFSVPQHQRPDHLMPLLPAAAMLASLVAAPWLTRFSAHQGEGRVRGLLVAAALLLAVADAANLWREARTDWRIANSIAVRELAARLEPHFPRGERLLFGDAPPALQFYLGVLRREAPDEAVIAHLLSDQPAYAVVLDGSRLGAMMPPGAAFHIVARAAAPPWFLPRGSHRHEIADVVSNRSDLPPATGAPVPWWRRIPGILLTMLAAFLLAQAALRATRP